MRAYCELYFFMGAYPSEPKSNAMLLSGNVVIQPRLGRETVTAKIASPTILDALAGYVRSFSRENWSTAVRTGFTAQEKSRSVETTSQRPTAEFFGKAKKF